MYFVFTRVIVVSVTSFESQLTLFILERASHFYKMINSIKLHAFTAVCFLFLFWPSIPIWDFYSKQHASTRYNIRPVLFTLHVQPLASVIDVHGCDYHK